MCSPASANIKPFFSNGDREERVVVALVALQLCTVRVRLSPTPRGQGHAPARQHSNTASERVAATWHSKAAICLAWGSTIIGKASEPSWFQIKKYLAFVLCILQQRGGFGERTRGSEQMCLINSKIT
jgi:hypothetical protein